MDILTEFPVDKKTRDLAAGKINNMIKWSHFERGSHYNQQVAFLKVLKSITKG